MSGAFGSFFDTQTNRFGIDFQAPENNVFGVNPFPFVFPSPFPNILANYDFNFYTEFDSEIANQVSGSSIGGATIHLPNDNTFDETDPLNKYLTIFAPDNAGDPTGGMTTPTITGVQSIEMWVNLTYGGGGGNYGQYLIDGRTGLENGFIIGAETGSGNVGSDWVGQKISYNTSVEVLTGNTNPQAEIAERGWFQIVLVKDAPFTDDVSLFCRLNAIQGTPLAVADVTFYDGALTDGDIVNLFNAKCSRYGLSPV